MIVLLLLSWCRGALADEAEDAAAAAARDAAPLPRYLSAAALQAPLQAALPVLAACPGFAQAPDGSLELRWRIAPGGEPEDLRLSGPLAAAEDVAACVQMRFLEVRFPAHDEVSEGVRAVVAKQAAGFVPFLDVQIEPRAVGPLFLKLPRDASSIDVDAWARGLGLAGEERPVAPSSP